MRFAFLLSIPAVLGANILTLKDAFEAGIDFSSVPVYLVGVVVAAVSGYASIRLRAMLPTRAVSARLPITAGPPAC